MERQAIELARQDVDLRAFVDRGLELSLQATHLREELEEVKETLRKLAEQGRKQEEKTVVLEGLLGRAEISFKERLEWDWVILGQVKLRMGEAFHRIFRTRYEPTSELERFLTETKDGKVRELVDAARIQKPQAPSVTFRRM